MITMDPARLSLGLGVASLLLWPLSYAWVPNAGRNPGWILVLVPVAEMAAVACAIAAIGLGVRARRSGLRSRGATWGARLGGLTLVLIVVGFVIGMALYG
jgi:hypothetical protein